MASPLIQFRAIDSMARELEARTRVFGERVPDAQQDRLFSETARRDLDRYYKAISQALYAINLSYSEAMVIVDALNGYLMMPELPQLMAHNVRDAIVEDGLDAKWGVDGKALIERLNKLSPLDCLAITDAVERWWYSPVPTEEETYEQRAVRVGLIRPPRLRTLTPDLPRFPITDSSLDSPLDSHLSNPLEDQE